MLMHPWVAGVGVVWRRRPEREWKYAAALELLFATMVSPKEGVWRCDSGGSRGVPRVQTNPPLEPTKLAETWRFHSKLNSQHTPCRDLTLAPCPPECSPAPKWVGKVGVVITILAKNPQTIMCTCNLSVFVLYMACKNYAHKIDHS
jgi:hypothetical protein